METRRVGSLTVSAVGIGCNNFGGRIDAAATDAVVGAALHEGITFFDTADVYGATHSEELLGAALGRRRDEVVVATKFGVPYEGHTGGAAPAYITQAVEDSLRRLGTDRIDLYQLHLPDAGTPVADTLEALTALVRQGKVREIGCSNFSAGQLSEAAAAAEAADGGARFVSVQNQYSILHREPEAAVLAECRRGGLAFLPFFPLSHGLLSGKYRAGEPPPEGTRLARLPAERAAQVLSDENLATVQALADLAAEEGHSVLDLAIAWLLSRAEVASVIAGATRPEQVRANAAAGAWAIPPDLLRRVDELAPAPAPASSG
jgi:aryl-alcohol dehydrogenase-like predicted oxidoreductase